MLTFDAPGLEHNKPQDIQWYKIESSYCIRDTFWKIHLIHIDGQWQVNNIYMSAWGLNFVILYYDTSPVCYVCRTFHRCFLPSFSSFGLGDSEEKIKIWKVNRRRMPSDGKSSHCLWQGEHANHYTIFLRLCKNHTEKGVVLQNFH
jgi:hypothetical protein